MSDEEATVRMVERYGSVPGNGCLVRLCWEDRLECRRIRRYFVFSFNMLSGIHNFIRFCLGPGGCVQVYARYLTGTWYCCARTGGYGWRRSSLRSGPACGFQFLFLVAYEQLRQQAGAHRRKMERMMVGVFLKLKKKSPYLIFIKGSLFEHGAPIAQQVVRGFVVN